MIQALCRDRFCRRNRCSGHSLFDLVHQDMFQGVRAVEKSPSTCIGTSAKWRESGPAGQCAPPFLGACAGLFLGVLHFPGSGVTRGSPRAFKVAACALIIASTVAQLHPLQSFHGLEKSVTHFAFRFLRGLTHGIRCQLWAES